MDLSDIIKRSQEQAAAAWIDMLNQIRLDELISKLAEQDENLAAAISELTHAKLSIISEIIMRNRGGTTGVHGFIAEAEEAGFGNAENLIDGLKKCYEWLNDNGPADLVRDGINIQQKFVQGDGLWGLTKIQEHLNRYPDFIKNGGKYQIPADFYEKIKTLLNMSPEEASRLQNRNADGLTYRQWAKVQEFFRSSGVSPDDLEPSKLKYADVQAGNVDRAFSDEMDTIRKKDQDNRDAAHQASKPTWKEGAKAAGVSAALEGGTAFCLAVAEKLRAGKKLSDFTEEDWKDVGISAAKGTGTGGIRGAVIYGMTNFTATPAAVASALVTASIGMIAEGRKLQAGSITEDEFINNSEVLCLDVTVSALASLIGQMAIPIPVLGAVVGNVVGMFMYGIAKDHLSKRETALIEHFVQGFESLNQTLEVRYRLIVEALRREFAKYKSIVELAFDPQVNIAFENSINLADYVGVSEEKVLRSKADIDAYFMS